MPRKETLTIKANGEIIKTTVTGDPLHRDRWDIYSAVIGFCQSEDTVIVRLQTIGYREGQQVIPSERDLGVREVVGFLGQINRSTMVVEMPTVLNHGSGMIETRKIISKNQLPSVLKEVYNRDIAPRFQKP